VLLAGNDTVPSSACRRGRYALYRVPSSELPVVTKANVDCEEDGGQDDADSSEDAHDDVDKDVHGQQLANSPVPRRPDTCTGPRCQHRSLPVQIIQLCQERSYHTECGKKQQRNQLPNWT